MTNLRRKIKVTAVVLVLLAFVSISAFAEYNRDHVVGVMRGNLALIGEIGAAADAKDWVLAAQKLFAISDGMVGIKVYDPPRGSKADWVATIDEFVFTAYMGIGACGANDVDALKASIAKLRALNKEGHTDHK